MSVKKLEVELKLLQSVASYYQFPMAVFFMQPKDFPKGTRNAALSRKADAYDRIKDIVEEAKK